MTDWQRRSRALAFWSLYAVAMLALVEATLLLWHGLRSHELYYFRNPGAGELLAAFQLPGAVFQPYYGYTLRPGRTEDYIDGAKWRANNFGFGNLVQPDGGTCCDYPYKPAPGDYVVGIFGGSVGSGYGLSAEAGGALANALRNVPGITGRKVVVLNLAQPGFRQPQQATTLAYFLSIGQTFDLVLNIDGFNEVVTSWKNWSDKVEPSYPADTLWGAWGRQLDQANVPVAERSYLLSNYHRLAARAVKEDADKCRTATCFYAGKVASAYHGWRARVNARAIPEAREQRSLFPTKAISDFPDDFDLFAYTGEVWRRSSLEMAAMARAAGAHYLHLLQPNQWYRETGSYTPIAADHIYGWVIEPVNKGYDRLREEGKALVAAGVDFRDLSLLFRGKPGREVYIDDCCHYTTAGYAHIFTATADALAHPLEANSARAPAPSAP